MSLGPWAILPLGHYTRVPEAGRTRPEELLDASAAAHLACGVQGCGFDSPRGHSPFAFHLRIMKIVFIQCAHSKSVASNHCKLWQNYFGSDHVQCGSLLWLIVYWPFNYRNRAPWLSVVFKKNSLNLIQKRKSFLFWSVGKAEVVFTKRFL